MLLRILDPIALFSIRIFVFLVEKLPRKAGYVLAYMTTRFFLLLMPRHRAVALRNMEIIFPTYSKQQKEELLRKSYHILAKNIIGFVDGPFYTRERVIKELDVSDAAETIELIRKNSKKSGTLLLLPHLGSFELLSQFWALYDCPVSIVAREFGFPKVDHWWNNRRSTHRNKIINRKGGYPAIISALRSGQNVAVLFDQNIKRNHATFVEFFGMPTATTKSIGIASLRTDCPMVFATMVEIAPASYKLFAYPIKKPSERPGTTEEQINATIRDANLHLETIIRKYPENWFWIHRRFKTRPEGVPEDVY